MKPHILVIDDEPDIRRIVREILEDEGYTVSVGKDGASAREALTHRTPNLILLDIWMPDIDGISLLREFTEVKKLRCPVVMMSGHGTVEAAVEATRLGASDFIEKPLSLSKLLLTVESSLANLPNRSIGNPELIQALSDPVDLIGKSAVMVELGSTLVRCAQHDVVVLLSGEDGTGKAHCARYIHSHSARSKASYIEFHTASLLESDKKSALEKLLGSNKSGVVQRGLVEQANGGTLFVDDIAELEPDLQGILYAAITTSTINRVGSEMPVNIDVRLIAATSHDLQGKVAADQFRKDLYQKLTGFPIQVPVLNQHSEDIPELLQHYVDLFSDKEGLSYRSFSVAAQNRLRNYSWPGNVQELENIVRRLLIQGGESNIGLDEIEQVLAKPGISQSTQATMQSVTGTVTVINDESVYAMPLRQAREQFERAYLEHHLKETDGSVGKVAKLAGLERTHLYRKLRSLNIDTKHSNKEN